MADSNQKKAEAADLPPLGEIAFSDSGDIPGVTQLLTPSLAKGRKSETIPQDHESLLDEEQEEEALELAEVEAMEIEDEDESDFAPPLLSKESLLQELKVKFELFFSNDGPHLTFQRAQEFSPGSFETWRKELFSGMKLDLKMLSVQSDFQEFSGKTALFQRDVFGLHDSEFLTFFRAPEDRNTWVLLVSDASLTSHQTDLESVYAAPKTKAPTPPSAPEIKKDYDPGEDDIKIEIA